jgi:hypothetical protein
VVHRLVADTTPDQWTNGQHSLSLNISIFSLSLFLSGPPTLGCAKAATGGDGLGRNVGIALAHADPAWPRLGPSALLDSLAALSANQFERRHRTNEIQINTKYLVYIRCC